MTSSPDGVPPGRYRVPHPPPVGVHNPARPRSHMRPLIVVNAGGRPHPGHAERGAGPELGPPPGLYDLPDGPAERPPGERPYKPPGQRRCTPVRIQPRIERRTHSHRLHPNAGTVNPPMTRVPPAATAQPTAARRAYRSTTRPTTATSTPLPNTHGRRNQGRRDHQAGNHSTRSAAAPFSLETRGRGALGGT